MNTERLLDAAGRLRGLEPSQFNIDSFVRSCGTAACAIGWMPKWYPEDWQMRGRLPVLRDSVEWNPFAAAAKWFDISISTAIELFHSDNYPPGRPVTAVDVAENIESLVNMAYNDWEV